MRKPSIGLQPEIKKAAELIRAADQVVALTGAGSSTTSGIPDFRTPNSGLWNQYAPLDVASLTTFRYQPEKFFEWLRPLAANLVHAKPNPAHIALARLEKTGHIKTIITQNIDNLHQRAGSKSVIEVHGNLKTLSCTGCFRNIPADGYIEPYIEHGHIPYCPNCQKILKPDVVLFEEQLPIKPWLKAKESVKRCDLMLVAGSSLIVMPVADLPRSAYENQAKIIVVNFTPTYIDEQSDIVLYGDVAEILPTLATEIING